jgi:hypothetical protein
MTLRNPYPEDFVGARGFREDFARISRGFREDFDPPNLLEILAKSSRNPREPPKSSVVEILGGNNRRMHNQSCATVML